MAHVKATAHAENLKTILDALHAGVDSIDHGSDLDQEAVDYMKAHGVYLIPTLHIVDTILGADASSGMPDYMLRKGKALAAKHFPSFKLALAAGVKMAAGNDGSYEPGSATVLDEIVTDVKYGMTPRQALAAGTKGGADCIGLDRLGTIAKGMEGDLVAVEGNPLDDIAALKHVKAVVHQGRVVVAPSDR